MINTTPPPIIPIIAPADILLDDDLGIKIWILSVGESVFIGSG